MSKYFEAQLGLSVSDTVTAVIGNRGLNKSSLCNRLRNVVDHPADGHEDADIVTHGTRIYSLKNSEDHKIMDLPDYGSAEWYDVEVPIDAAMSHLHAADCVLLVISRSFPEAWFEDLLSLCLDLGKPFVLVQAGIHDIITQIMQEECLCRRKALELYKEGVLKKCEDVTNSRLLIFCIDDAQWQNAIKAYEAGEYDAAKLHYDEGKLLKFVTGLGLAKSLPRSSSDFLERLFETESKRETTPEETQLETVLQDVHYINRNGEPCSRRRQDANLTSRELFRYLRIPDLPEH